MRSLRRIQMAARLLRIWSFLATVFSFLLAGAALVCLLMIYFAGDNAPEWLYFVTGSHLRRIATAYYQEHVLLALAEGVLHILTHRYLDHELEAGTPFTREGAREIGRLGILTLVISIAAQTGILLVTAPAVGEMVESFAIGGQLMLGVVLLLFSAVFRYGAELQESKEE